jgi:hypothetical protein
MKEKNLALYKTFHFLLKSIILFFPNPEEIKEENGEQINYANSRFSGIGHAYSHFYYGD